MYKEISTQKVQCNVTIITAYIHQKETALNTVSYVLNFIHNNKITTSTNNAGKNGRVLVLVSNSVRTEILSQ